jgi:anion-transporting  ArsA/GET3 family ATPase
MERRRDEDGRLHYDLVVVDAPPTGRIVNFLRAPDATTELVNVGPVRSQAQSLVDMLLDDQRTCAVLVTLLEEMPVAETVEGVQALRELGVAVGPIVVNRVLPERFDEAQRKALAEQLDAARLRALLAGAELEVAEDTAAALLTRGREELERLDLQVAMRDELEQALPLPRFELPEVYADEFTADELGVLAELIEEAFG